MPTTEGGDTTSRVTRSLRKRLTSMDSEASSRPGTPNLINLQAIPETMTPSKRITRRTSISTPAATPSKPKNRFDATEVVSSPARRTTRRRSLSIQDQDEHAAHPKLKEPSVEVVKEEESLENRRVTRSSSKSPFDIKKNKSHNDSDKSDLIKSDILDTSEESAFPTPSRTKKNSKVLIKKEKVIDGMVEHISPSEKKNLKSSKKQNESTARNDSSETVESVETENEKTTSALKEKSPQKDKAANTSSSSVGDQNDLEQDIVPVDDKNTTAEQKSSTLNDSGMSTSQTLTSVIEISADKTNLAECSLQEKESTNLSRSEEDSAQKNRSRPEKLKNVIFEDKPEDDAVKNVYPKTPGLTKSKSYIHDASKEDGETEEESAKMSENQDVSFIANRKQVDKGDDDEEEDPEALQTKTPHKMKLMNVESSTPIHLASPSKDKATGATKSLETDVSMDKAENTSTISGHARSWTQSVSGTVKDTPKIDVIVSESAKKKLEEEQALTASNSKKSPVTVKKQKFEDSDDDCDDMLEEDENDNDDNEEEDEEDDRERTIFVDDEAMEVPDGEESMSSSERRYLEENEVPVRGESIGSEDTDEDETEFDDEGDEEDDDFIVSDDDDILSKNDSESDVEIVEKSKDKKYKRISKMSDSSNEDENCREKETDEEEHEKSDFRLMMESSEEEAHQNEKEKSNLEKRKSLKKATPKLNKSGRKSINTFEGENVEGKVEKKKRVSLNSSKRGDTSKGAFNDKEIEDHSEASDRKGKAVDSETDKSKKSRKSPSKDKSYQEASDSLDKNAAQEDEDTDTALGARASNAEELNSTKRSLSKNSPNKSYKEDSLSQAPSRKSLNKSRHSESNDDQPTDANVSRKSLKNKSLVQNLIDEQKNCSDLERTLSATEVSPSSPTSLESSVKKRTSLNRSKFFGNEDNASEKSPNRRDKVEECNNEEEVEARFSDSDDDEEEVRKIKEKSSIMEFLGEQAFNTPNKSHRNQGDNSSEKANNCQDKAEDYNNEEEVEARFSDSDADAEEAQKIKEKSSIMESFGEKGPNTPVLKKSHRKSMNQSKLDTTFEFDPEVSNKDDLYRGVMRKSLNQSQLRRQSIHAKKTDPESKDSTEEVEERPITKRHSLNQSQLRKRSLQTKTKPESEDENDEAKSSSSEDEEEQVIPDRKSLNRSQLGQQSIHENRSEDNSVSEETKAATPAVQIRKSLNRRQSMDQRRNESESENQAKPTSSEEDEPQNKRKSLNHSQLRRQSIYKNKTETESEGSNDSDDEPDNAKMTFSERKSLNQNHPKHPSDEKSEEENDLAESSPSEQEEEKVSSVKKFKPDQCLSVSLSNFEVQKKKAKHAVAAIHNSFTIGVSVRRSSNAVAPDPATSSDSGKNDSSEGEESETNKKTLFSTSLKSSPHHDVDIKQKKKTKKQDNVASKSFTENLLKDKIKSELKRKRHSNSFCGTIVPPARDPVPEPVSEKKKKDPIKTAESVNIQSILNRCDEMLEAANRAKREAKLNAKKAKVKKPKWSSKEEKKAEEDEVKIPLVSKKELKRKEKIKKELAKAIKHSTVLLKTIDPKLSKKLKSSRANEEIPSTEAVSSSSKRLPVEVLEALEDAPPKKKRPKDIDNTPPSDKENSRNRNRNAYLTTDIPEKKQKKKGALEIIETACGMVVVEPATPVKAKYQNGFRESPKTPAGFTVQNLNSNKARKVGRPLFTSHGSAVESTKKSQKRKRVIEEPRNTLPKTQWTSSGVFIEEDLPTASIPINSASTHFMVASLNAGKKTKDIASVMSTATLNSALSFKQNALFNQNKMKRESSREMMQRKQRKLVNSQF